MSGPMASEPVAEVRTPEDSEEWLGRLEELWDDSEPDREALLTAHAALQGAWFSSGGRRDAELLVSGRRFTMRFADGDIYMGVFDLNPLGRPMDLDMHIEEGPSRHRGQTALCLCECDGDTLRFCTASPGAARPTAFAADGDPQFLCLTFRREQMV